MGLEQNNEQHYRQVVDKFHDPNETYLMTTRDYVLRPSADGISGPINIHLPPVGEAKGRWYSIIARNADGANDITISDRNDSECWVADVVLDGKCDRALFYSDGLAWHAMGQQGAWPGVNTTASPGTTPEPPTTAVPTTTLTTVGPTTYEPQT